MLIKWNLKAFKILVLHLYYYVACFKVIINKICGVFIPANMPYTVDHDLLNLNKYNIKNINWEMTRYLKSNTVTEIKIQFVSSHYNVVFALNILWTELVL